MPLMQLLLQTYNDRPWHAAGRRAGRRAGRTGRADQQSPHKC